MKLNHMNLKKPDIKRKKTKMEHTLQEILDQVKYANYDWFETYGALVSSSGDSDGDEATMVFRFETANKPVYVKLTGVVNSWNSFDDYEWEKVELVEPVERVTVDYVPTESAGEISRDKVLKAVKQFDYFFFEDLENRYPEEVEIVSQLLTVKTR